jgi:ATP-dependent DNA helicase RecG
MEPVLRPVISAHQVDGVTLIVAEVQEIGRDQKPCYYKPAGLQNGAFIRVGDGDRKLTDHEIHVLIAGRNQPRDDISPVADASIEVLDRAALSKLRARIPRLGHLDERDFMLAMKVAVEHQGRIVPTLAGLLTMSPYPQQYLP